MYNSVDHKDSAVFPEQKTWGEEFRGNLMVPQRFSRASRLPIRLCLGIYPLALQVPYNQQVSLLPKILQPIVTLGNRVTKVWSVTDREGKASKIQI